MCDTGLFLFSRSEGMLASKLSVNCLKRLSDGITKSSRGKKVKRNKYKFQQRQRLHHLLHFKIPICSETQLLNF